jgi:peptidoglycan/LPS O-acetylase OafA/YrhL
VQPFAWLGDISYSLYLLHMPVGFAALGVLHRLEVPNSLATFLAMGAVLMASTGAYLLVEKPSQRLARRLLAPRASVTA